MAALTPVDLVVPVYNEAQELPAFIAALAAQEGDDGRPLPAGLLRVIVVDSESTDGTDQAFEAARRAHASLELVLLQEPVRSHVAARARGAEFALASEGRERSPILVSADIDTRFHPRWIADVAHRLGDGELDAVTYAGHYFFEFWRAVPTLAQRYFDEIGTIFFGPRTISHYGFDVSAALFREEIFFALPRVPSDCAWAYTKDAYERVSGYRREFYPDGREVMFEGRNLRFRLDRIGARVAYANETPFETSPRRLLFDAERVLAGTAYAEGLQPLRGEAGPESFAALEGLAGRLDFETLRRYVVKHYMLLPVVSRPSFLRGAEQLFGPTTAEIGAATAGLDGTSRTAAEIHDLADVLLERLYARILVHLREARQAPSGA